MTAATLAGSALAIALVGPAWPLGAALCGWLLAAALAAAVLALRRRFELVAQAEHELRGPLTAFALGLEALGRDSRYPHRVVALGTELDRVRLALADLQAAQRGRRAPPRIERIALGRLARLAVDGWAPVARRAGGGVRLDWRAGPVAVRADRARLSQALGNLLSNAVEHGGGDVELRARRTGDSVRLEVSDSGPGFAAGAKPDGGPGRGHGLRLAARAIEQAGGTVTVAPAERGATLAVELPVAEPRAAPPSERR